MAGQVQQDHPPGPIQDPPAQDADRVAQAFLDGGHQPFGHDRFRRVLGVGAECVLAGVGKGEVQVGRQGKER